MKNLFFWSGPPKIGLAVLGRGPVEQRHHGGCMFYSSVVMDFAFFFDVCMVFHFFLLCVV